MFLDEGHHRSLLGEGTLGDDCLSEARSNVVLDSVFSLSFCHFFIFV